MFSRWQVPDFSMLEREVTHKQGRRVYNDAGGNGSESETYQIKHELIW